MAAGCAAASALSLASLAGLALLMRPAPPVIHVYEAPVVERQAVAPAPAPVPPVAAEPFGPLPPSLPGAAFRFVVEVDGAPYMVLGLAPDELRRTGLRVIEDEWGPKAAVRSLDGDEVPAELAGWRDQAVTVGDSCAARVESFALIGLMTGDLGYMGLDEDASKEDIAEMLVADDAGLIAARLSGCAGDHARAAYEGAAVRAIEETDPALVSAARTALFGSAIGDGAQALWEEAGQTGAWWQAEYGEIAARVLRHPETGARQVLVHAVVDDGCGGAGINLLVRYEVGADGTLGAGTLVAENGIGTIEHILDIDGDGAFEISARRYLGDLVLLDDDGSTITEVEIPFYGCPC